MDVKHEAVPDQQGAEHVMWRGLTSDLKACEYYRLSGNCRPCEYRVASYYQAKDLFERDNGDR